MNTVEKKIIFDDGSYVIISEAAKTYYNIKGEIHRNGDLPAKIWVGVGEFWYRNGSLHRDNDLPACVCDSWAGSKHLEYFKNGKRHRDNNRPAFVHKSGYVEFWENGNMI